jgi:Tfp pilus assembly protein PilZ
MENRRRHLRIPFVTTVRITRKQTQKTSVAFVRDICTHGIGVYTNEAYEKGDILVVDISLQDDKKEQINGSIVGEVVWIERLQEEDKYAVGIRFKESNKEKSGVYEQIRRLEQRMSDYQNS